MLLRSTSKLDVRLGNKPFSCVYDLSLNNKEQHEEAHKMDVSRQPKSLFKVIKPTFYIAKMKYQYTVFLPSHAKFCNNASIERNVTSIPYVHLLSLYI